MREKCTVTEKNAYVRKNCQVSVMSSSLFLCACDTLCTIKKLPEYVQLLLCSLWSVKARREKQTLSLSVAFFFFLLSFYF